MKRVAVIGNYPDQLLNFRGPLMREMVQRGHTVYGMVPGFEARHIKELREMGVRGIEVSLQQTGMNPVRDLSYLLVLIRKLRDLEIDIAFCYTVKPVIYGSMAAKLAGVSCRFSMIEGLGYVFANSGESGRLQDRILRGIISAMYRYALSTNERVFMLNPDDIEEFTRRGLVQRKDVYHLNGIGVDLRYYVASSRPKEPVTFLLVGRLLKEKGVCEYVQAAKIVKSRYPETRFLLVGGVDPNPGSLSEAEVKSWVEQGLIEWPGQVRDVRPWISQSSVFVLPSYYREGVPRSTQEAMAMARPVITTDAPGCRETVIEGENGFMIPPRNSEALAETMMRFIDRPEVIDEMGRHSRELAEEKFDVEAINRKILAVMDL